jgi:hypothetical protein
MKHVIIFQDFVNGVTYGHQWQQEELFNYFRSQVDNALRVGVDITDIIVCTNLDFSYKDATIIKLKDECKFNKYFNKQYGILELLRDKHITEPFWFHDFDDWALQDFNFPTFRGDIGMCKYIDNSQWNTGSIFVKPESVDIWELIVNFMKGNQTHPAVDNKGDENIVNMVYNLYPEIQHRFSHLNNQYNVGCTQFDMRYDTATKPVYVGAFKPGEERMKLFVAKGLVPTELISIFNKHTI